MRFFHLSDLHIGLKLLNRDLGEDQAHILRQIAEIAGRERPDAMVIAGDLYDKAVPSQEAVELFDRFIMDLRREAPGMELMLISGNHDSAQRLNCFRSVLSRQGIHMIGLPPRTAEERVARVVLEDAYGKVSFYLLPFVRPSMVRQVLGTEEDGRLFSYDETIRRILRREEVDPAARNVLVSHQFYLPAGKNAEEVERMDSEIRTVGNIDEVQADVLERFDYAALGHIHKPMRLGRNAYYCGTPLCCSVSEAGQQKGILSVELGPKGQVSVETIPLSPLRQVRVLQGSLQELLSQACDDYVRLVLMEQADLDVFDVQDRLRSAFPYLLEIRREGLREPGYEGEAMPDKLLDPFSLCLSFLQEADEEEQAILREAIHAAMEGG